MTVSSVPMNDGELETLSQAFAKPYFDKGKAWNFTALERHIF
jgi:hypothetical protein